MSARRSTPPPARSAAPSTGPASEASHSSRRITRSSLAPKRSTAPSPSLMVAKARLPATRFSTTNTGIEAVMSPVIGPTAPRLWQGASATAPRSTRACAAASSGAQPS